MTLIRDKFGVAPPKVSTAKNLKVPEDIIKVISQELIGIEVEVENASLAGNLDKVWHQTEDGSLRNNGIELISSPIPASIAPAALHNLLTEALSKECSFSPRTSVHIHLNCQDIEVHQVIDMILLYGLFEKLFYRFAGRGRNKNIYCVPITETNLLTGLINNGITEAWEKYTGLNARPLYNYGTLEFRHMHGTFDVNKLCIWINLITSLKEYVRKTSTETIRETLSKTSPDSNIRGLLTDIFGDWADYFKYESYEDVAFQADIVKTAYVGGDAIHSLYSQRSGVSPFFSIRA